VAEQAGIGGKAIGLAGLEAQHVGQDLAELLIGGRRHRLFLHRGPQAPLSRGL